MFGMLHVMQGEQKNRTFSIARGQKLSIGRSRDAGICLTDPHVSRLHCNIEFQGKVVTLSDAGGIGGTWVNGERITQWELQAGDLIRIGETQVSFQWSDTDEKSTEALPRSRILERDSSVGQSETDTLHPD